MLKKIFLVLTILLLASCSSIVSKNNVKKYVTSLDKLENANIGLLKGSIYEKISRELYPNANFNYYATTDSLILAVESREIDTFLMDKTSAVLYSSINPPITFINENIYDCQYGFIFPKTNTELLELFNNFLKESKKNGYIDLLEQKWFTPNGMNQKVENIDLSSCTGETITAVTSPDSPPFVYIIDGVYEGYEIDLLYKFCLDNNFKLVIKDSTFSDLVDSIETGKYDLGFSTVTITDERKELFNYSEPTYNDTSVFVVARQYNACNSEFSSKAELDGKVFGALKDSYYVSSINRDFPNAKISFFSNRTEIIDALLNKEIDAYIIEEEFARDIEHEDMRLTYDRVPVDYVDLGFVFSDNKLDVLKEFNKFLEESNNNGYLQYLQNKYSSAVSLLLDKDDVNLTGKRGTLKVSTSSDSMPFTFISNDEYCGYDIELFEKFCEEYDYNYEIIDSSFDESLKLVKDGECDVAFNAIGITDDRKYVYNFSDKTYTSGGVILTRNK